MNVLGSDNCTQNSCSKISRELSRDNKIYLEIHSLALLSMLDDVDAIYANNIKPHEIFMNTQVPKCFVEKNKPCSIMISELIGSATSRRILRVLFNSGLNRSLIHKRVLPETACVKACKNLNPTTTLGGTVQLNQTVTLEQLHFPEFNKNIKLE